MGQDAAWSKLLMMYTQWWWRRMGKFRPKKTRDSSRPATCENDRSPAHGQVPTVNQYPAAELLGMISPAPDGGKGDSVTPSTGRKPETLGPSLPGSRPAS